MKMSEKMRWNVYEILFTGLICLGIFGYADNLAKESYYYEDWIYSFSPLQSSVIYVNNGNGERIEMKDSLKIRPLPTQWDFMVVTGKDTIHYPLESVRVTEKTSNRTQPVALPDSVMQYCLKKVIKGIKGNENKK